MKIDKNKVVYFHYTLSEVGQQPVETSDANQPSAYLHGYGNILAALEEALEDKCAGDELNITLSAEQAYGERREGMQQRIPIKHLITKGKLRPGMAVKINTAEGARDARILNVGKFNVDIDLNHPLAGMSLTFDIRVVEVREASHEEIAHGHAHGDGGHHH